MNFTQKEDYGLRASLDLAVRAGSGPVQTRDIASRQGIPEQFLEQLLAALRRAEIVRSTRGAGGGYALSTPPSQITVGQILRALSGPLVPTELVSGGNDDASLDTSEVLVIRSVWGDIRSSIRAFADNTTLQDLLDRRSASMKDVSFMMNI
ncbi:MAG: Rrf2 family transcriptional regulator [bacterium]|jgi:Rrf2 family protein